MKITIFGSGYVGLVTGACFAQVGNDVLCIDKDEEKVERLRRGEVPIHEPGLDAILAEAQEKGLIRYSTNMREGVEHGLFQFIAVGTPPDEDGSADLQHVLTVARTIGEHMNDYRVVIDKSTVPVGTADKVRAEVVRELERRGADVPFDVVSNPEFLKEGAAIADFSKPDRIIVGAESEEAAEHMKRLYAPFNRNHDKVMVMDVRSAELTKYAANAMLAAKISVMNEFANIAERLGADIEHVRTGIGSDPRIGYHFIYPGCGYGGSCFPKDVKALIHTARQHGWQPRILEAVEGVNEIQKNVLFHRIREHYGGDLAGKTFALWGLAFKPNTDDMREAPSRELMEALWEAGAKVRAYDPEAMVETRRIYGARDDLQLCKGNYETLEGADAMVVCTEWNIFRSPDFGRIKSMLKDPVVFDGRNIYEPDSMADDGFTYYGIGRGESVTTP